MSCFDVSTGDLFCSLVMRWCWNNGYNSTFCCLSGELLDNCTRDQWLRITQQTLVLQKEMIPLGRSCGFSSTREGRFLLCHFILVKVLLNRTQNSSCCSTGEKVCEKNGHKECTRLQLESFKAKSNSKNAEMQTKCYRLVKVSLPSDTSNVVCSLNLPLKFNEKDVDTVCVLCSNLSHWQWCELKKNKTLLLQCVFTGKAEIAFSTLKHSW